MARHLLMLPLIFGLFCATARPYRFTNFTQNAQAMASIRANRVAVLPLAGPEGTRFADEFSLQLGKLGRFDIVERQRISDLYREQDMDPARVDKTTAVQLGKMLGAHAVVMGTITDYRPGRVGASVRLVSVETGEIAWQGSDALSGGDARVQALVEDRADRARLGRDADYLAMWLARLMAESIR
ncbi:MAG: CsgG/HfaB family protein [candidate division WOR-3 bacterium]